MDKIVISLVVFLISLSACQYMKCENRAGIKVSELLMMYSSQNDIPYCDLLRGSVNKNVHSFKSFLRLRISDGAGYDHGTVLLELFLYLDEDFVLESTQELSAAELDQVRGYLKVGIEYSNSYNNSNFESLFPQLKSAWSVDD